MNTSKNIYTKSKEHLAKGYKFWIYTIDFLNKIKNLKVFTFIVVSIENITFNILSKSNQPDLLFRYVFKLKSFSENSIDVFIKKIKNIVKNLNFDKKYGYFYSSLVQIEKPLFFEEFGLNYIDKDNCIECLELTTSKLSCEHFCCIYCWKNNDKIINNKCTKCSKISEYPKVLHRFYFIDNHNELTFVTKWLNKNYFFQKIDFGPNNFDKPVNDNLHYGVWGDEDDVDDEDDEDEDDDNWEDDDEDDDEDDNLDDEDDE